jgi:hypothetical protein
MEKRKKKLPKGVQMAVFKEDPNSTKGLSLSGNGALSFKTDPFANKHFVMIQDGRNDVPYTESRLDGPDDIRNESIHEDDDPERAILVMGLPATDATWTMSLRLHHMDGTGDELHMRRIAGRYDQVYQEALKSGSKIIKDVPGMYFTMANADGGMVTCQNINQAESFIQIDHQMAECFDHFLVSFLGLSTK